MSASFMIGMSLGFFESNFFLKDTEYSKSDITTYFKTTFIVAGFISLPVIILIRERPDKPPSYVSQSEREPYFEATRKLF